MSHVMISKYSYIIMYTFFSIIRSITIAVSVFLFGFSCAQDIDDEMVVYRDRADPAFGRIDKLPKDIEKSEIVYSLRWNMVSIRQVRRPKYGEHPEVAFRIRPLDLEVATKVKPINIGSQLQRLISPYIGDPYKDSAADPMFFENFADVSWYLIVSGTSSYFIMLWENSKIVEIREAQTVKIGKAEYFMISNGKVYFGRGEKFFKAIRKKIAKDEHWNSPYAP